MENEDLLLDLHRENVQVLGFWDEIYKATVIASVECLYKSEVIKYWTITDIVINGDKCLTKWKKRFQPLTNKELKDKYGK